MEKEEILRRFEEKGFNEETKKYLLGAIQEFEMFLSPYLSTEEVVERICQNLEHNIEFVDSLHKMVAGTYSYIEKKICLDPARDDEEKRKTFFHEFLHCITTKEDEFEDGYISGFQSSMKIEDKIITSEIGINEGVVAYLTEKRNALLGEKSNKSYELLRKQIENLVQIIPEEELLHCFFHEPEQLEELFEEYNLNYARFMVNMDSIYSKTKEMDMAKAVLTNLGLGVDELRHEKEELFTCYMEGFENIQTLEDLKRKLDFFENLKQQFPTYDMYDYIQK